MLSIVATQLLYPELIIRSSLSIATNLITSARYLSTISSSDKDVQKLLNTTDIIEDVICIKTFIEEKELESKSQTVHICIENLSKSLECLESKIRSISIKIENHKLLWFNYFRSYNISEELISIPLLIEKVKHRFDLLIKISSSLKG